MTDDDFIKELTLTAAKAEVGTLATILEVAAVESAHAVIDNPQDYAKAIRLLLREPA